MTRLKAASKLASSVEVKAVSSAPCATSPGWVMSSFVVGSIGRRFSANASSETK